MARVEISFDEENIQRVPIIKINGKKIKILHDVHFDWNTKTSSKGTAARSSVSYWNESGNLVTKENYTAQMLGNHYE